MKQTWIAGILILACYVVGGCGTESQRLADMADRTVEMQSKQNLAIAKTRDDIVELNRAIQMERKELNQEFKQLESDRRELHKQRRSELAWAESFQFLAIVFAATMPLFLCAYLIWAATRNSQDAELINDVLMRELVTKRPRLIAGPNQPAIESNSDKRAIESAGPLTSNNPNNNGGHEDNVTHCSNQN
jgi:hypothetical protein